MKVKAPVLLSLLIALGTITGVVIYKAAIPSLDTGSDRDIQEEIEELPIVASSVRVEAVKSRTKDNTVAIRVRGMDGLYASVAYELTYESQGLIKGVNSGSKPIEVAGSDGFEREVYLGTCSRNVCKPDLGVSEVTVVLEFTDKAGKKSQFSKTFDL